MIRSVFFIALFFTLIILSNRSCFAEGKQGFTVVALGDSTTAGTPGFFSPAEKWPKGQGDEASQYAYWILQDHPAWTVLNRGVRGQRSDQILWRFKRELSSYQPDLVIILAGVNDLYQGFSVASVEENLKKIYELALTNKMKIMACTILPYNLATDEIRTQIVEVNAWIRSYSREQGFLFCDTYSVLDDPQNPGNLVSTPDGYHPDRQGYEKMGKAIERAIASSLPNL